MFAALLFSLAIIGDGHQTVPPPAPVVAMAAPAAAPTPAQVPLPTTTPTTTPATPALAVPGHYACTGMDNATAVCVNDESGANVTPNTGDDPSKLLSATDPAYAAYLTALLCEAKPWMCS